MICETCIYRNRDEYHKPCIVYRDDCEHYESEEDMSEVGVEIVKTEEAEKSGIKYLNINVSNSEVERKPDIVRLCADAGILEYVKTSGDAISRQTVLDGIDTYIYKAQSTGTQDDFYSFAELVVKQLPSVTPQEPKTGHWIPVTERLPNKDRYIDFYKCLVAVSCTSRNDICDSFTAYFDGKHFYRHLYDRAIISGVNAWMPLPTPYEPQESEVGIEIVKTKEVEENGIKYLNINVSNSEVERNPDIVRLCSDVGMLEYVKPKTGHWIYKKAAISFNIKCSECGYEPYFSDREPLYNYCPNCSAKMSEIPTGCSNSDSCENCKYDDGECCRLIYEAKMFEPQERNK